MAGMKEMGRSYNYRPEGSITPIVTPAKKIGGTVLPDEISLKRLTKHIIDGGSDGIFGLGTSGEFTKQSLFQKEVTIHILKKSVKGRVPLLIGVSSPTIKETECVAKYAEEKGVTAVVVAPMYGEGKPEEKLKAVKEATELPIVLYNNPDIHGGSSIPVEFVKRVHFDPQVVGMKDSSQDDEYKRKIYGMQSPDFSVLEGQTSHTLWSLQKFDAAGVVNWLGNAFPSEVKTVFERKDQKSMDNLLQLGGHLDSALKIKKKLVSQGIIDSALLFSPSR